MLSSSVSQRMVHVYGTQDGFKGYTDEYVLVHSRKNKTCTVICAFMDILLSTKPS